MKKVLFFLLACICLQQATAQETTGKVFYSEPEILLSGKTITLFYDNRKTDLRESKSVTGVIYLCHGDYWTTDDLQLAYKDSVWTATYTLPDNCVLLACKFYGENGVWDSGRLMGQYGIFVQKMGEDNTPKAQFGSYVNWGFLRSNFFENYAIPGFSKAESQIDDRAMQMWINYEYRYFPNSRETLSYFAAKLLDKTSPGTNNHLFIADLDYILSLESPAELSLIRAAETYKTIIKDTVKSNEIEKLILQRFQDGILARDLEIRRIYMLSDPEEKDKAFSNLLKRFPPVKFSKPEAENSRFFYTRLFWSVMNNRITSHNDYSLLYEHLPIVPYVVLKDYYYRIVQLPLKHELKTYKELRPYADAIYDEIIKRSKQGEDLYYTDMVHKRFSPAEWEQDVLYEVRGYSLTHAEVLYETGAYEKALEISESIKDYFHGEVSSFNEIYAKLLVANNYPALVVPFVEASIKLDAATPQMLDLLKTDFVKKNPAGNFDQYINKLRSKEYVEKQEEELKNKLINKDIEPFVLESPNGVVNMADLKGKVIVLDFWATWCSPCKAAMPGMQMVVDKYKDNPNVAFFFISTLETSPNYKDAIDQFLKEKSYPFNVLYDKDPANNKQGFYYYKYAKAGFGVNGIPHKMVIDRNGKLRWSSGGYFGNPQALANEISFLVDYLLEDSK